jgi:hypothetical protein
MLWSKTEKRTIHQAISQVVLLKYVYKKNYQPSALSRPLESRNGNEKQQWILFILWRPHRWAQEEDTCVPRGSIIERKTYLTRCKTGDTILLLLNRAFTLPVYPTVGIPMKSADPTLSPQGGLKGDVVMQWPGRSATTDRRTWTNSFQILRPQRYLSNNTTRVTEWSRVRCACDTRLRKKKYLQKFSYETSRYNTTWGILA